MVAFLIIGKKRISICLIFTLLIIIFFKRGGGVCEGLVGGGWGDDQALVLLCSME